MLSTFIHSYSSLYLNPEALLLHAANWRALGALWIAVWIPAWIAVLIAVWRAVLAETTAVTTELMVPWSRSEEP